MALNGTGPGFESFVGCSGTVSFDNATGSRSISTQLPEYDLVSLTPKYWEMKGLIKNGSMLNLTSLTPPGSEFGPNSTLRCGHPCALHCYDNCEGTPCHLSAKKKLRRIRKLSSTHFWSPF
ncbi:hypothetical protein M758_10G188000 [Ceratodon purpureus]|uniref:Uncharacterized protein n=1 Tax=Ceratodon purpureus TaxID=3225 RepID=A0A8T0GQW8_CERPU|nr:hypothetical protein KC19_10G192400 [Ceratodon purpureus]KAG0604680.1 hypothetical protein M758_10G188000 [Ceratodon purpureus]